MPNSKRGKKRGGDHELRKISRKIFGEVKEFAEFQRFHLLKYAEIGMSLSGEEDTAKLLELIVAEAKEITRADAGSLYMVNDEGTHLDFVILQNDTMNIRLGGTSGREITLPPVPLYVNGKENHGNVSSHVAITGTIVNIPDVYKSEDFDFSGTRRYDQTTGYLSRSMLVIPMRNHENDVIGVLQLLNAEDRETGKVVTFFDDHVTLIASLASQAAVALTKTRLLSDLKELLDAFIKSIAAAIEEKSRYTGGHIRRVSNLTLEIAEQISRVDFGPFRNVSFTPDEMEELRLAAWLHDIGKITTPQHVVDKHRKLETIFDRIELVNARFDYIAKALEADFLRRKVALLEAGDKDGAAALDAELAFELETLAGEKVFVGECNSPGEFMSDDKLARLEKIAAKQYVSPDGDSRPYLTDNELENLSVRKGNLTAEERIVIENHARMTHMMLKELPFPKKMARVAEYASGHHERMDGSGYPLGLSGEKLPLQARIMAVADIFEALTAKDRPYKKPMKLSQAVKILGLMSEDKHIDSDVYDLLMWSNIIFDYAGKELNPDQVDIEMSVSSPVDQIKPQAADTVESMLAQARKFSHTLVGDPGDENGPKVLVVDDSVNARMLMDYFLRDAGCRVDIAESGLQGVEMFAAGRYDVVFVDLGMPDPDGYDTIKAMRILEQERGMPETPMVAMTAHLFREDERLSREAGHNEVFTKPFTKADLDRLFDSLGI